MCDCTRWERVPTPAVRVVTEHLFWQIGKSPSPAHEDMEWFKCTQTDCSILHDLRFGWYCLHGAKWKLTCLCPYLCPSGYRRKHVTSLHSSIHTPALQAWQDATCSLTHVPSLASLGFGILLMYPVETSHVSISRAFTLPLEPQRRPLQAKI